MDQRIVVIGQGDAKSRMIRKVLRRRFRHVAIQAHVGVASNVVGNNDVTVVAASNVSQTEMSSAPAFEDRVRRAEFLFETIRILSSLNPMHDALSQVLDRSKNVLGDTAFLLLFDSERLEVEHVLSNRPEQLRRLLISLVNSGPDGLKAELWKFLKEGQTLFVPDVSNVDYSDAVVLLARQLQYKSIVATPVKTDQKLLGILVSVTSIANQLDETHVALSQECAQAIATALQKAQIVKELESRANTDALTGLYNARFFNEVLTREIARVQRRQVPLSLLMIDVDDFKHLNDHYGHISGNDALRSLSAILQQAVRITDFVFRCGGDEFAILLPGTDLAGAMSAGEHIRRRVEATEFLSGKLPKGNVTVSVGVSSYNSGLNLESFVGRSDQALYSAKRLSKNKVQVYPVNSDHVSITNGSPAM